MAAWSGKKRLGSAMINLLESAKVARSPSRRWAETQLIHALHCRPRRNAFENEVAILMGSGPEFNGTSFSARRLPRQMEFSTSSQVAIGRASFRA